MEDAVGTVGGSGTDTRRLSLRARRRLLLGVAVLTAGITLGPMPVGMLDGAHEAGRWIATRLPGSWGTHPTRGETEALLNVAVPMVLVLVIAAAWPTVRSLRLLAGAFVVSLAVETAQFAIPGRHPQLRDLLLNTVGAGLGVAVVVVIRRIRAGTTTA